MRRRSNRVTLKSLRAQLFAEDLTLKIYRNANTQLREELAYAAQLMCAACEATADHSPNLARVFASSATRLQLSADASMALVDKEGS